jgi:UDP-N-acetylglucosamine 2-epimerase (non-hydrolysing)/GDP/UDP-N,N'-diacetylbacillosamine 2-epimerase (hydrolysing)
MQKIQADRTFKLQLIVTGSHLSSYFGSTWRTICEDGFRIDRKIPILVNDLSRVGVTRALGKAVAGFSDALQSLAPDFLIVLGDRYEILGAVSAALIAKIPVVHIAGGDITEGAFDDAIRHAITKMSHLHFVTNEVSRKRVLQMGEDPRNVKNVGHLGIDSICQTPRYSRPYLEKALGFRFQERNLLVTFHPVTLGLVSSEVQMDELLRAIRRLGTSVGVIFTHPNADTDSSKLRTMLEKFSKGRPHTRVFCSLGQNYYLNVMRQVDAVVGNSSSGIYEAPSLKKPTVNVGDRQSGRLQASSVINCDPRENSIFLAIRKAFRKDCSHVRSPYGNGNAASEILKTIRAIENPSRLLRKRFFEWETR